MTFLQEVLDIVELQVLIENGYVSAKPHPQDTQYRILNYTHRAVGVEWTPTLRECRGLIVKVTGFHFNGLPMWQDSRVLARPFAKFFNSTEPQSSWLSETPGDTLTIAMDKSDGSLGIAYLAPDGLPAIATRGSFNSDQAIHATALLRSKYPEFKLDKYWTSLFEIVFPENRIVLDYGNMDDLIYLGYREIANGMTYPVSGLAIKQDRWNGPVAETLHEGSLSGALALGERENREGMVLYVFDKVSNQFRLTKVKQADYVALHRIVTGLNERVVWEELKEGRFAALIENLPAEHAVWANGVSTRILDEVYDIISAAVLAANQHKSDDQKTFALWAVKQSHSAGLFAAFAGNHAKLVEYAWKQVRPEAAKPRTLVNEEA